MKIIGDWWLSQTNQILKFKLCWCMRRKLTHQIQLLVHKLAKMLQIQCISNVCSLKKYHFISQDLRCNILIFLLLKRRRLKKFAPNKLQLISRINRASSFYMTLTSFLMVTRIKDNRNITSTLHVPKKCHSLFCSSYITLQPETTYSWK